MKLFTNPASPFCRKVEVLLREAGLADQVDHAGVAGHATDPGTLPVDVNPIGKIPTFETGEGKALYDSRVITRYLDDQHDLGLYPADSLYDVLTLEATADGIADAAVLIVYEGRSRADDKYDDTYVEAQWGRVVRALDQLEANWIDLLNAPLNMGQIAVGCALGYLDFRHGARNWREGRPNLTAWFSGFGERPAMKATMPPG